MESLRETISKFTGMKKRQELLADCSEKGIELIDDYAHHPTAVQATLAGMRKRYPKGQNRILAIFEPRSNSSRRKSFESDYPACSSFWNESGDLELPQNWAPRSGYHDHDEQRTLWSYSGRAHRADEPNEGVSTKKRLGGTPSRFESERFFFLGCLAPACHHDFSGTDRFDHLTLAEHEGYGIEFTSRSGKHRDHGRGAHIDGFPSEVLDNL